MTWTYKYKRLSAVVSADSIKVAIIFLEKEFSRAGIDQKIKNEQLVPMVTGSRYARILSEW